MPAPTAATGDTGVPRLIGGLPEDTRGHLQQPSTGRMASTALECTPATGRRTAQERCSINQRMGSAPPHRACARSRAWTAFGEAAANKQNSFPTRLFPTRIAVVQGFIWPVNTSACAHISARSTPRGEASRDLAGGNEPNRETAERTRRKNHRQRRGEGRGMKPQTCHWPFLGEKPSSKDRNSI